MAEALNERERLAALSGDIGIALTRGGSLGQVLQRCCEAMVLHLNAAFARVWVLNPSTDQLELSASAGLYTHLDGDHGRVPVGKFKIGLIAQERRPHLTNDVVNDPRVSNPDWARREGIVGFAGYPLIVDDELLGVAAMFSRQEIGPAVLESLETIANGVALSIRQKQGEADLRSSEARKAILLAEAEAAQRSYRELAEAIPQQVWTAGADGSLDYVNQRVLEFFRRPAAELLGAGWLEGVHPDDVSTTLETWTAALRNEATYEIEFRLRRASDQMYRWHLGRAVPMRDKTGRVLRWLGTNTDIHDNKRTEADLLTAKAEAEAANQAKSQFLASMSHELRTPLNAVIGYSEMLQEEAAELGLDRLIPDLQKIHRAGGYLLSLINNVLDLSKIEAGKMELFVEDFDVEAMLTDIAETAEPLIQRNGNRLDLAIAEGLGPMRSDLTKVRQCLLNLLSNAAKFTSGGAVELSVRRVEPSAIVFRVSDTGAGIPADKVSLLFEPFSQAHDSRTEGRAGTGLGLAITRRLCNLMGGGISVESKFGKGSAFTIFLPIRVPEPETGPVLGVPPKAAALRQGRVVLVVDDDSGSRDLMVWFLEKEGYSPVIAVSGQEALQFARQLRPSLITLDVILPDMNGWQVLRTLKGDPELAGIPVIMVTIVDDKATARGLGAVDYLTKPFDRKRLSQLLDKYAAR